MWGKRRVDLEASARRWQKEEEEERGRVDPELTCFMGCNENSLFAPTAAFLSGEQDFQDKERGEELCSLDSEYL